MTRARAAGWYADPVTVGAARYWDGGGWTPLVAWGGRTLTDSTPIPEVERRAALHHNDTVSEYLDDAVERGIVTYDVATRIRDDLHRDMRTGPAARSASLEPRPPSPRPSPAMVAPRRAPTVESTAPAPRPSPLPPPPTREPTREPAPEPVAPARVSVWWADAKRAVGSDLALHGLAYLGVLLLFAGVTGLVVFSFGNVAPWVRSVTELMVPAALFISAWYLSSRGARVVGDALTLLGGAITPIVVAAAFTDGAPIPPDVDGRALPIVQATATASVAVVMALAVRHRPSSPLRFLVGPILWLSAGLAAGIARDPVPTGYETARPDAFQLAIVLAAIAVTMVVIRMGRATGPLGSATAAAALPTAGVVYVLELVLAGTEDWPLASTIVTGLAALLLLEACATRLPVGVVSGLQFAAVATTALRTAASVEPQWVAVGTLVILLALLEYVGRRRPDVVALAVGLVATAVTLAATLVEPATTAIGFGTAAMWGLWRYLAPAEWLPARDTYGVVPAVGVAVTAGAIGQMIDPGLALVGVSAAVCLIAAVGRMWTRLSTDVLWTWFVPAAAAVVCGVSLGYDWDTYSVEVGIAGTLSASALALSALPSAARVWSTSAVLIWALANFAHAADVGLDAQAVALGTGALLLVVTSIVVARPLCAHLAAVGHVAGLLALAVPTWPGWPPTVVLALAAAGWWATTLVDDRGEAVQLGALRRGLPATDDTQTSPIDAVAELAGSAALGLTVVAAGSATLAVDPTASTSWVAVACGAGALAGASAVRVVHWHRARRIVFEWVTFAVAVTAACLAISDAAPDRQDWSAIVAAVIGLAVVALATAPRPVAFVWVSWVGIAAITLLLADRFGLERVWLDTALAMWGAIVLVGALVVQRRLRGPIPQFRMGSDPLLLPPTVLGASGFAVGGMSALLEGSESVIGWTAAAMAAVALIVALLLPLGAIVAVAEALATVAYALLAPWNPVERPTTFVPWVVAVLVVALLTRSARDWWPARWDLPSFWTAHAVAGVALALAVDADTVAVTSAAFAAVSLTIAAVLRRVEWSIAAAVLLLVAGATAGPGWLGLVLLVEGLVLTVVGLRRSARTRSVLLGAGAVALVGSWFDVVTWLDWSAGTIAQTTAAAAAGVALVAALGLGRAPTELVGTWAATGTLVSVGSMVAGIEEVSRRAGGLTFALSMLALAATAAALTELLGPAMRWIAALTAAAAWLPAAWAVEPTPTTATLIGTFVAVAGLATALGVHGLRPQHPWIVPVSLFAVATQGLAATAAAAALPDDALVVVVLLAASAELIALGVIAAQPGLFVLSPVAACAAWIVAARDTLAGEPNWFAVPIGVTLLVMVGLVRWIRRGRGEPVTGDDVILLEFAGMTVVVASPIAQLLDGELWNAIVAVAIGVLLANWGALTRVRRRAAFGAATVVLSIVLVIAVPLSTSVTWRGPALWIALGLLGIAAILVASTLERGRDTVAQVGRRLDEMTEGWERIPHHGPRSAPPAASGDAAGHGPQTVS